MRHFREGGCSLDRHIENLVAKHVWQANIVFDRCDASSQDEPHLAFPVHYLTLAPNRRGDHNHLAELIFD